VQQYNTAVQQHNTGVQQYSGKIYSSTTTLQFNNTIQQYNTIQHYNNTILSTPYTTAYGLDILRSGLISPSACPNKETKKQTIQMSVPDNLTALDPLHDVTNNLPHSATEFGLIFFLFNS